MNAQMNEPESLPRDEPRITRAQNEMATEALCKLVASGAADLTLSEACGELVRVLAELNARTMAA